MALGKKRRNYRQIVSPKLQITAMMDMFTIILIFLLFSFAEKPETMALDGDMKLPESTAKMDYRETVKLVLSQKDLKMNDRVIAIFEKGQLKGLNPDRPKDSHLYRELVAYREAKNGVIKTGTGETPIMFLCDKRIPFKTINSVIKTAGHAGFPDFQFAVLKK